MKCVIPIRKVIVFSQWSRKGYAIFASLGKNIKIGPVAIDICDKALQKTSGIAGIIINILCLKNNFTDLLEQIQQAKDIPDPIAIQLVLVTKNLIQSTSCQNQGGLRGYILFNKLSPRFIYDKAWTF